MAEAKEKQLKKWLFDRVKEKYIPFINKNGDIEFHPWIETQSNFHKPSTTNEIQHSKVETPTPQSAGIIQNLDNPILMPSTQERSP